MGVVRFGHHHPPITIPLRALPSSPARCHHIARHQPTCRLVIDRGLSWPLSSSPPTVICLPLRRRPLGSAPQWPVAPQALRRSSFACCKGGATAFFPQDIPGDQMVAMLLPYFRQELGSSWRGVATGLSGGNTLGPAKVHGEGCGRP